MQTLLIIAEGNGYLPMSIKKNLENVESGLYNVLMVPPETNAIYKVKDPISGILIYVDRKMTEEQEALNFLKDQAIMDEIPIFLLGDLEDINSVKRVIPQYLVKREFVRPINVIDLVSVVNGFMKQHGTENKKKILVVDDSGDALRSIKGWLGERYNVFLTNSAAMALKYLATNKPDLMLLDYEMPIVDGKQVLEMLKAEMDFNSVPVMFLTNRSDKETKDQVMALKPEGYLLKSMEPFLIIKAVDDFFERLKGLTYMENAQ